MFLAVDLCVCVCVNVNHTIQKQIIAGSSKCVLCSNVIFFYEDRTIGLCTGTHKRIRKNCDLSPKVDRRLSG